MIDLHAPLASLSDAALAVAAVALAAFMICLGLKVWRWLSQTVNSPTAPRNPRKPSSSQGGGSSPGCSSGRAC